MEFEIRDRFERAGQARQNLLEMELTKVAKIQSSLKAKVGVSDDICDQIARELEKVDDPGKRLKVILDTIVEGYKGDQEAVQEQIMEQLKKMPPAKDKKGIEDGIMMIKKGINDWLRSANMEEGSGVQFSDKAACNALERLCLNNQGATAVIRACKADLTKKTFENQAAAVKAELERLDNLLRLVEGEKKADPVAEYRDSTESAVVGMGAMTRQSVKTCIQFNNTGRCSWGNNCIFNHVRTGTQIDYPAPREDSDRGRSRGGDRGGGSGGGDGGARYDRADRRSEGGGGDSRRGGGRDRSRSPNRSSSSSSSSSSSREYRNQDRDERGGGSRSRSNSSVRSNDSDNKATPPKEKEKDRRPDTPKR